MVYAYLVLGLLSRRSVEGYQDRSPCPSFQFQGSDIDATGVNFSTSIPLSMALNPRGAILLATHMNGEPLPPDHGAPLRALVPGAPAVRSVKWLGN